MGAPGTPGELLLDLGAAALFLGVPGPPWVGPGMPSAFPVGVPNDADFLGQLIWGQGIMFDTLAGPSEVRFALTNGLLIRLGP
jgi:hypothetical protein